MLTNLINVPVIKVKKEKVKKKNPSYPIQSTNGYLKGREMKKKHGLFSKVRGYKAST